MIINTSDYEREQEELRVLRRKMKELQPVLKYLLDEIHVADWVYQIRERADLTGYEGSSWEHPDVVRFGNMMKALEDAACDS